MERAWWPTQFAAPISSTGCSSGSCPSNPMPTAQQTGTCMTTDADVLVALSPDKFCTRLRLWPKPRLFSTWTNAAGSRISVFLICFCLAAPIPAATRVKDLVSIEGVRDNHLVGYGVVVGLNKTGDKQQTIFSTQSLANMLQKMGDRKSTTSELQSLRHLV